MAFVKRHWIMLSLAALFLWAVYSVSTTVAKLAAVALAATVFLLALPLIWLLLPVYALGYAFGFLPNSLYDWLPRSSNTTSLNTTIVQPQTNPDQAP